MVTAVQEKIQSAADSKYPGSIHWGRDAVIMDAVLKAPWMWLMGSWYAWQAWRFLLCGSHKSSNCGIATQLWSYEICQLTACQANGASQL